MAHDIFDSRTVSTRVQPWHGINMLPSLDTQIDALQGAEYVLKDLTVRTVDIALKGKAGYLDLPSHKAIITVAKGDHTGGTPCNGHTVFTHGIVDKRYETVTHSPFICAAHACTGGALIETMGLLGKGGSDLWILYPLPSIDVHGDEIRNYLLITNPLDGKTAITARTCSERVVCRNTWRIAMGEQTDFTFRGVHHPGVLARLEAWITDVWGHHTSIVATLQQAYTALAEHPCTQTTLINNVLSTVYPLPEKPGTEDKKLVDLWIDAAAKQQAHRETIKHLFDASPTITPATRGTLWGAVQAVIEYEDYGKPRATAQSKFAGSGQERKQAALNACLALV